MQTRSAACERHVRFSNRPFWVKRLQTTSIVPRGTSPPLGEAQVSSYSRLRGSESCCNFSGPPELAAVNPDAVHDHANRRASATIADCLVSGTAWDDRNWTRTGAPFAGADFRYGSYRRHSKRKGPKQGESQSVKRLHN